ncbi:MAG TPA: restriction endonuclease subunit S [bacterium]|nr:restriction endonuclease subunit S [bacterium]
MVTGNARKLKEDVPQIVAPADLPEEELRWCPVSLNEVFERGMRLEASVFDVEGKHAREVLNKCRWPVASLCGDTGLATAYHRPRFRRIWVDETGIPIYQPSQILDLNPKPSGYLSDITDTDIDALIVKKGQVLLTCSGTIGLCTVVADTFDNRVFSHDLIRITANDDADTGYIYAFMKTKVGGALIRTNEYGAVISHIEPEHLASVPIPSPPKVIRKRVNELVARSFALRDESNELLAQAEKLLYDELQLLPLNKLRPSYFDKSADLRNFTVKLSNLSGRVDGSYHVPIVDSIMKCLRKNAAELTDIGDARISKEIRLPGRFTRIYVQEGQGAVYFTGKRILELDPADKKYLAFARHEKRIKEQLEIKQNMLLVTSSGTLGKVVLVPKHWEGWTMTHDIIRIIPVSEKIAGFVSVFLISEYGEELMKRFTYGSVVDHIEAEHIIDVPVPLLKSSSTQAAINDYALEANEKRTEAYNLEQEAIRIVDDDVIHAVR